MVRHTSADSQFPNSQTRPRLPYNHTYTHTHIQADTQRLTHSAAMKPQEITEALQLNKLKDKIWYVVPSCATTGEGLAEGLAWLSNNVKTPPTPAKK